MKKFYLSILFLCLSLYVSAQAGVTGSSAETGVLNGDLSVTLSGGASYNIPIIVPPGIKGVEPQLSLSYNSQGTNGPAGYGWGISGISTISRIPATKFHDNTIDGVDFNALDRFALDGQRLILKNTGQTYGADNTIYETEIFSNLKITSYGVHPSGANYGPAYFKVEYPDGSKAFYGNSTDSRSITEWSITYWENAQGARISYAYNSANNLLEIASVKYGTLTTTTPINTIKFIYEARSRQESYYVGGQNIKRVNRLKDINITGNGIDFKNYNLQYTIPSLKYDYLYSVTEINGDKTKSLNPTTFTYNGSSNNISYVTNPNTLSVDNASSLNASAVTGDFDGDGNMDFILYPTTGTSARSKYWLFTGISPNTGAQTFPNFGMLQQPGAFQEIFPVNFLSWTNKLMYRQGWTVVQGNSFTTYAFSASTIPQQDQKIYNFPRFVLDYYYDCSGFNSTQNQQEVQSFSEPVDPGPGSPQPAHYETDIPRSFISGDFNGDGLTDIVSIEKSFTYPYTIGCSTVTSTYQGGKTVFINLDRRLTTGFANGAGSLASTNSSKIQVGDFNGDGKSDIFVFDAGTVKIYSLNDNKQFVLLLQTSDTSIVLTKPILIGDYNGDGKSDFMIPKETNSGWYRYVSTGTGFVKESKTLLYYLNDSFTSYNYTATDYNNDGKSDFNIIKNYRNGSAGTIQITSYTEIAPDTYFSTSAVTTAQAAIDIYALPIYLPSTDKRNPRFEVAFINNNKLHFFNSQKDSNKDRLLNIITNGNGVQELITYQPLDQIYKVNFNSVYSSSEGLETYPYFDLVASPDFQIVSKLEKKSETVSKMKLYGYYGAVTNYEGLGFMGFRSMMESNWHDSNNPALCTITSMDIKRRGAVSESYFLPYLTYPYNGFTTTNFTTKNVFSYTPVNAADAVLPSKVFKQQNTGILETNTLKNSTTETANIFDGDNYVTNSTITTKEGGNTIQVATTAIVYPLPTATPFYISGRPSSKTETITLQPGGSTLTRKEVYTYNSQQLLDNTVKTATNAPTITETNNLYDSFGNIKTKTISSSALSRVNKYEYDTTGRFLTKITDPNLLSTSFEYYSETGLLKKKTDPYAQSLSFNYDSWFKMLTVKDDQLNTETSNVYNRNGKETSVTTTRKSISNLALDTVVSEAKFDDLQRNTRTGVKDLNGSLSYTSYLYDIYDRPYKVSEPYFTSVSQWNETKFDIYSRPTQNILFNGKSIGIAYTGLKTTITDGQKSKELTSNAIGKVVSSYEPLGGTVNYSYFADGKLNKTSYNGIDITAEQNGWGYKTKLTDPSAGTYLYAKNDFGELTSESIQNAGIVTTITRDPASGKITSKTITDSGTDTQTSYTYDGILPLTITYIDNKESAGTNTTVTTYNYDNIYRRVTSVVENKTGVYKFTRTFTYDALGRIATQTRLAEIGGKSSSVLTQNVYKNGGLHKILDANNKVLWQANTFNAKGQIEESVTGNDIKMTNAYNTDGYLFKTQYDKTSAPTANILTLGTSFDKSNDRLDNRTNSAFNNYTEAFEYDNMNRLTKFTNKSGVQETQAYDTSGKILSNNLGTYNYDPAKKYQNTAIMISPEAAGYYSNREGIFNDSMEDKTGWGMQKYPATNFFSYDDTKTPHAAGKNTLKLANTTTTEQYVFLDKWIDINNSSPTQYTYSAWVYSDSPQSQIFLYMKDAANNLTTANTVNNTTGTWTQIIGTFTVPANIRKLCIRLDNNGLGNIWYDDVEIRKTSDPTSSDRKLNVTYNAFKSPIQIEETNVDKISFSYNDNNQRSIMYYGGFQTDKLARPLRKYYSNDGSMEVKENRSTNTFEFITYVGGDGYSAPVAVKSDGTGTAQNYLYLHRDYQGSIIAVTDANANIVEKRLFDAWGSIIKVQDGAGNTLNGLTVLDRGYTGHEHIQSVGLINMNARLYDPILRRFLQTDNIIQDVTNTQNYNAYGYVYNNPLSNTDITGNSVDGPGGSIGIGPGTETGSGWDLKQFDKDYRISEWWKKNINGDKWSDAVKDAGNFIGNNFKSLGNNISDGFKSLFGNKNDRAPQNVSNYVNVPSNTISYQALPELVKYNREYKEWEKKSFIDRLISGRPENPYMSASSGVLGWISGPGGLYKTVQYSGEALNALKKTEYFYGAAESEKAIAEIMAKMKVKDPSIYIRPVFTYLHEGEIYILNGHHRVQAAIRSGEVLEATELTGMGTGSYFTENLLKIEEILAGWHL
ncbi:FG-GAP-like repeat-containing protein [Flavobacterium sp.]|uniref:FG-GAP-like repeat-containing protein n=1 Tax=Flavobacterium sp. TaxID=239 RepID=UPI0031E3F070